MSRPCSGQPRDHKVSHTTSAICTPLYHAEDKSCCPSRGGSGFRYSTLSTLTWASASHSLLTHLSVHKLIHIGNDHGALYIEERKGWRRVAAVSCNSDSRLAHPSRPLHAPVAEPGLTKKRPSKSNASKLR